jgi:hypothetical protein
VAGCPTTTFIVPWCLPNLSQSDDQYLIPCSLICIARPASSCIIGLPLSSVWAIGQVVLPLALVLAPVPALARSKSMSKHELSALTQLRR